MRRQTKYNFKLIKKKNFVFFMLIMISFSLGTLRLGSSAVTLNDMRVRLTAVDVTDDFNQAHSYVKFYFGAEWQRIYSNYWGEFDNDNDYDNTDEYDEYIFTEEDDYEDIHYDSEYTPWTYSKNHRICIHASVSCNYYYLIWEYWSTKIVYLWITPPYSGYQTTITVNNHYGGSATFYFTIYYSS